MSKIAFVTDTHFGCRNDSPQFLEYFFEFFTEQFFPYLKRNNITKVIHLGDLLDRRKYVNFLTLSRVQNEFIKPIKEAGIEFHCIIGNHDTYYKNTNDLNSVKELFENSIHIYNKPQIVTVAGFEFAVVPWINRENESECMDFIKTAKADILLGHLELRGYEVLGGIKSEEGTDPKLFGRYESVYTGHFHHRQSNDNIHYLGTPYQITFNDVYNKNGFYIFDTETRIMDFQENEAKIFYSIRYNDKEHDMGAIDFSKYRNCFIKIIIEEKTKNYMFDKFVDSMYNAEVAELTVVEQILPVGAENEEPIDTSKDTITIINDEIDRMSEVTNKNKLKTIIHDLYIESLSE